MTSGATPVSELRRRLTARTTRLATLGLLAGLLVNYWLLEALIAARVDPAGSWVSELGARSESTGWIFSLLDVASGFAIIAFALALRPSLSGRSAALRYGVWALVGVGICAIVDGAFPLSCADALTDACELRYDAVDIVHATETIVSVAVTVAAYGLMAYGFRAEGQRGRPGVGSFSSLAVPTALAGVCWLVLNALMGVAAIDPGLEDLRGVFHRLSLVVLGCWLILLGAWIGRPGGRDAVGRG